MTVNAEVLRELKKSRADLSKITDAHTRRMVKGWQRAWNSMVPELRASFLEVASNPSRKNLQNHQRLQRSLRLIGESLDTLTRNAGVDVGVDIGRATRLSVRATETLIRAQLPPGIDLSAGVDERQLKAIINRSTERLVSSLRPIAEETAEVIAEGLVEGVAKGQNPRETAKRMMSNTLDRYNFSLNRATVIARTETLDAYREAGTAAQRAQDDLVTGWQWITSLSARTCGSCISHHGEIHPLSDPGPLDHQMGRCARAPVTKTWKEMGFDIPEPPSAVQDKKQWFESLSDDDQKQVLGPTRFAAYKRGDYPMEKWSVRRSNKGWRDSYVMSKAPHQ